MIEFEKTIKYYPPVRKGAPPVKAVDEVSFSISKGQFVSIVGPSGCGKTTVLNMAAGFERPSAGRIVVSGQAVTAPGPDRAVVFQQPSLFPWMTVAENIAAGLIFRSGRKSVNSPKVTAMIRTMGLEAFANHSPYHLSGGMQQRAAIGRAMVTDPEVLLMDEPFGALDAQTRSDMQRFLLGVWDRLQITVLFITHDVDEAVLLSDRVIVMSPRPGRIAADIPIALARPRPWDVTLGSDFLAYKRAVLAKLHHGGADGVLPLGTVEATEISAQILS